MAFNEETPMSNGGLSRRQLLRGLTFSAGAALLAACGATPAPTGAPAGSGASSGAANPAGTTAPAATSPLEGDISVRYFPFGTGVEEVYQGFADEFKAANPGVNIMLDLQPWENRYPKMLADLAAGQGPDVMFVTTDVLIRFVGADVLVPAEDLVAASSWDGYSEAMLDEISYEGKRWFAPMDVEVPIWIANTAILERAGVSAPPATWDEMRDLCAKVAALGDPNLWGWGYNAASATLNTTFYPFLYQAGGRPISEDGSTPTFNSEAGVAALSFIVELFQNNWVSQQYLQPIETGQDPFTLGTQAISIHNVIANLITLRTITPDRSYTIGPVLSDKEAWGFGGRRSWAISKTARNQRAAVAFLEFLISPEIMARHAEPFGAFPTKATASGLVYQNDLEIAGLSERISQIFGEQKHKYGRDLMPLVTPEIQAAILGQKTPKEALDYAAVGVSELFAKG